MAAGCKISETISRDIDMKEIEMNSQESVMGWLLAAIVGMFVLTALSALSGCVTVVRNVQ